MGRITKHDIEKITDEDIRRLAINLQETRLQLRRRASTSSPMWVSNQQLLLLTRFHNLYEIVKRRSRQSAFEVRLTIDDLACAIKLLDESALLIDPDLRRSRFEIDNLRLLLENIVKQYEGATMILELREKLGELFVFPEGSQLVMPATVPQRRKYYFNTTS